MSWWQMIKKVVISREVATFCAFFVVASLMWLMFTIGTQREMTISVPVVYYGIPDDVKMDRPLPTEVQFTIEEDGSQLLNYLFAEVDTIDIDLSQQFSSKHGHKEIKINFLPLVEEKMNVISTSCNIVSVEPAVYASPYSKVYTRRVPVRLGSLVNTAHQYTLRDSVVIEPSEVLIRGVRKAIDTVSVIYVDTVKDVFRKSSVVSARLIRPRGVELLTKSVNLHINVERQTEKQFMIPVEMMNVPDNVNVHLFPKEANVVFTVGVSRFNSLSDADYHVIFDFNNVDTVRHTCPLQLVNSGEELNVPYRIVPSDVEYLIEKL